MKSQQGIMIAVLAAILLTNCGFGTTLESTQLPSEAFTQLPISTTIAIASPEAPTTTNLPFPTETLFPDATQTLTSTPGVTATFPPIGVNEPIRLSNINRIEKIYSAGNGGDKRLEWEASPDGKVLANIDETNSPFSSDVTFFDSKTGQVLGTIEKIHYFAISPNGKLLAFTSENKTVLEDFPPGKKQTVLNQEYMESIKFSPDNLFLAADGGTPDNPRTTVWNVQTGTVQADLDGAFFVTFNPDNKLLVCGSNHTTVELWDIQAAKAKTVLSQAQPNCSGATLQPSPDGTLLAGSSGNQITIWNVSTNAVQAVLQQTGELNEHVAFSPDGTLLASVDNKTVRIWDTRTGIIRSVLSDSDCEFTDSDIAFSPDGRFLVSSGMRVDTSNVCLWDIQTGSLKVVDKESNTYDMRVFAFSPGGTFFADVGMYEIRFWDLSTGQALFAIPMSSQIAHFPNLLMFNNDGTALFAAPDDGGKLQAFGLIPSTAKRAGVRFAGGNFYKFRDAVPATWLAVEPTPARYEIRFEDHSVEAFTCSYTGNNKIVYYQEIVEVTITDLQTFSQLANSTFRGADTGTCSPTHEFAVGGGIVDVEYNEADVNDFVAWLTQTLSSKPDLQP